MHNNLNFTDTLIKGAEIEDAQFCEFSLLFYLPNGLFCRNLMQWQAAARTFPNTTYYTLNTTWETIALFDFNFRILNKNVICVILDAYKIILNDKNDKNEFFSTISFL